MRERTKKKRQKACFASIAGRRSCTVRALSFFSVSFFFLRCPVVTAVAVEWSARLLLPCVLLALLLITRNCTGPAHVRRAKQQSKPDRRRETQGKTINGASRRRHRVRPEQLRHLCTRLSQKRTACLELSERSFWCCRRRFLCLVSKALCNSSRRRTPMRCLHAELCRLACARAFVGADCLVRFCSVRSLRCNLTASPMRGGDIGREE